MSDDLRTLRLLLERAEAQRDEALAERTRLEAARKAADTQAEQLALYRREYEQRWHDQFCRSGQIELVRCYQGFMARLTQAVEQQHQVAAHAVAQVERAAALAQGHEVRAQGLMRLIERRERESAATAARHEQRAADEHAARARGTGRRGPSSDWAPMAFGGNAGAPGLI